MAIQRIVERIAKEKIVENIVFNIVKNSKDEDYKDLINDIYLELLEKNEDCMEAIYDRGQINFFITRIVMNNINSKTSRFYYRYRKNKKLTTSMEDAPIQEQGETPEYD